MKTGMEIAGMIEMPEQVKEELNKITEETRACIEEELIRRLTREESWEKARQSLKEKLGPDEKGMRMLWCMLCAAGISREEYKKQEISEDIFTETMKCFTRFVREHKESYGDYGFDRDFWTGRQLSLSLFRIGELEYEKVMEDGMHKVSVHIPSDARLTPERCRKSLEESVKFFERYDGRYVNVPYICHSWLLSPALEKLLPESSNILQFQKLFQIQEIDYEETDFLEWVYKRRDLPVMELPQETSLQRTMKEYLIKGGKVGAATGTMQERWMQN